MAANVEPHGLWRERKAEIKIGNHRSAGAMTRLRKRKEQKKVTEGAIVDCIRPTEGTLLQLVEERDVIIHHRKQPQGRIFPQNGRLCR